MLHRSVRVSVSGVAPGLRRGFGRGGNRKNPAAISSGRCFTPPTNQIRLIALTTALIGASVMEVSMPTPKTLETPSSGTTSSI